MAESSEDLREQVARLLWWSMASNAARAIGWDGMDTTTRDRFWDAADSLLPLFATRERAAAEKELSDAIRPDSTTGSISMRLFAHRATYISTQVEGEFVPHGFNDFGALWGYFVVDGVTQFVCPASHVRIDYKAPVRVFSGWLTEEIRAQLEGEEA